MASPGIPLEPVTIFKKPTSRKNARHYVNPIGPPTPLIDPTEFLNASKISLGKVKVAMEAMRAGLSKLGDNQTKEVEERCSVETLYEENTTIHANYTYTSELVKWHEPRLFAGERDRTPQEGEEDVEEGEGGSPEATRRQRAESQGSQSSIDIDIDENELESGRGREGSVENGRRKKRFAVSTLPCHDPDILKFLAGADESTLSILKPLPDLEYYIRRTKLSDYNTLTEVKPSPPIVSTTPPKTSPLNSLLYTITIHPTRKSSAGTHYYTKAQTLVLLASTTLWELKESLLAGGDEIPVELVATVDEDDNEDEDEEDEEGVDKKKKVTWGYQKRDVGSVWGIEGILYADGREDKTDYAEMVLKLTNSIDWSKRKENDRDDSPEDTPEEARKPQWKVGTKMQETRLGDLKIKIGEPYWYLQQGNSEHTWTVDAIRQVHPSDPQLLDSSISTAPYPSTIFVSRLNQARCRICLIDPGSIITIDDELAEENPCLMCKKCFDMLHGGENCLSEVVNVVPKLME